MRQAALLVALVCVLSAPVAGALAATGGAAQAQESVARDGVDITVQLQADGDARWNVSATYRLNGENETAAFERLVEQFKNHETDNGFSVSVFRAAVPAVSERVGRPMQIRRADRTATLIRRGNNSTGVLSLTFTWTNFTQVNNETLVVDSFAGTWFGDLKAGQTLTIRPPPGYDTEDVRPGPDAIVNGAYRWTGPQSFESGQPRAVFSETPANGGGGAFGVSLATVVGVGVLALVVGGGLVWLLQRDGLRDADWFGGEDAEAESAAETGEETPESGEREAETGGGEEPGGSPVGAPEGVESPELLSDEERVEHLLREHGGRMKQSKIVEETRWSTAKVSQLLSSMEDEDRIEKLRIGRENLISLPGEGVNDE